MKDKIYISETPFSPSPNCWRGAYGYDFVVALKRIGIWRVEVFKPADDKKSAVFVADKDLWCFGGIPKEYDDIVFTVGYSIENDAMSDSAGYAA